MQAVLSQATNGESWFQAFLLAKDVETGDENCDILVIMCSLFVNNTIYRMLSFVMKALKRILKASRQLMFIYVQVLVTSSRSVSTLYCNSSTPINYLPAGSSRLNYE